MSSNNGCILEALWIQFRRSGKCLIDLSAKRMAINNIKQLTTLHTKMSLIIDVKCALSNGLSVLK